MAIKPIVSKPPTPEEIALRQRRDAERAAQDRGVRPGLVALREDIAALRRAYHAGGLQANDDVLAALWRVCDDAEQSRLDVELIFDPILRLQDKQRRYGR